MNVLGLADGNWRGRIREDTFSSHAQWPQGLTDNSNRSAGSAISVRMQPAVNER
jgi:hypothetical protein